MRNVWAELTRRDRNTGEFFHPIRRSGSLVNRTQEQAHDQELGHLLHFVFCTACNPPIVSKPGEIEAKREEMLQEAQIVHKIAADLLATNASDSRAVADAAAMLRSADWWETGAHALRPPTDPLTIQNDRGDRALRGAQTEIAAHLLDVFGSRLDSTAATLTAVAFGLKATSPRVSRSAFSGSKSAQRS